MMYMHYCQNCQRIFMLNGHKMICPRCTEPLTELKLSYLDYIHLDQKQRDALLDACADKERLENLKTTYRMYKYSNGTRIFRPPTRRTFPLPPFLRKWPKRKADVFLWHTYLLPIIRTDIGYI